MIRPGRMRIVLVRKLANYLDGIDVSEYQQGDIIDLPWRDAELLIAERWAAPYDGLSSGEADPDPPLVDELIAADRVERRTLDQLRKARVAMENRLVEQYERRRAEDRIREELRDGRARTINGERLELRDRTNVDAHSKHFNRDSTD